MILIMTMKRRMQRMKRRIERYVGEQAVRLEERSELSMKEYAYYVRQERRGIGRHPLRPLLLPPPGRKVQVSLHHYLQWLGN